MINENIYTMDIETIEGVKQHPFHLGTDRKIALTFVSEQLAKPENISVRLKLNNKTDTIFHCHTISLAIDSAYNYDAMEG